MSEWYAYAALGVGLYDLVDPKYPKDRPLWTDEYSRIRADLASTGSRWRPAFAAVVEAEQAGMFDDLKKIHATTSDLHVWQYILWELCKQTFLPDDWKTWPEYARAVREAVPDKLTGHGRLRGIPEQWYGKEEWKRVWAFKSTVLFIAGLIEGQLPPVTRPAAEISKSVDESLKSGLRLGINSEDGVHLLIEERVAQVEGRVAQVFDNRLRSFIERLDELERGLSSRK